MMALFSGLFAALAFTFGDPFLNPEKYNKRLKNAGIDSEASKKKGMWKSMDKNVSQRKMSFVWLGFPHCKLGR